MRSQPKIIATVIALSTACAALAVQPGGQTNEESRTRGESSLLIEPPANSATKADPAKAIAPANASGANLPEALPPPRRPSDRPVLGRSARLARRQPFLRPTEPEPSATPDIPPPADPRLEREAIPAPPTMEAPIQPTPPITTDTDPGARRMYRSSGEVELVMVVQNPADGCLYEIPLCVPACCTGEPAMNEWRGLFGRGVVEYCWDCGFTATVKFRHILGDVKVDYDG